MRVKLSRISKEARIELDEKRKKKKTGKLEMNIFTRMKLINVTLKGISALLGGEIFIYLYHFHF